MALQAETIIAGFVAAWQASASLTSSVPGGIWFDKAPQVDLEPYATVTLETEDVLTVASRHFIQTVRLNVAVYGKAPMTDASRESIRNAVNSAWLSGSVTISGGSLIAVIPVEASVELPPDRRDAEDVLVARAGFQAMIQGSF